MSDQVKNTIKNVSYPFSLTGNDFKELSLLASNIQKIIKENGKELAEYIYRHMNHYQATRYQDVLLKDFPSSINKNNFIFKEWLDPVKAFKDKFNLIGNLVRTFENYIDRFRVDINNNMTQARLQKQRELLESKKEEKEELIKQANNLSTDLGIDEDQIMEEQVRVMEEAEKIDKSLEKKELKKVGIKLLKEKLLIKDIEILGVDDNFLENANQYELIQLIKNYLQPDEKIIKNTIKAQWDTETEDKVIGIKGIDIKIKGVK